LDGHTQSGGTTDFQRHITFHHNIYHNVNGRLPLQRGGWVHAYNNLYSEITGSGINVRANGIALVENNWFENSKNPLTCRFDTNGCGKWEVRGNNVTSSADNAKYGISWDSPGTGGVNADSWTSTGSFPSLPYSYTPASAACVRARLASVAGVGKNFAALSCN
jgi:pectate lyase